MLGASQDKEAHDGQPGLDDQMHEACRLKTIRQLADRDLRASTAAR